LGAGVGVAAGGRAAVWVPVSAGLGAGAAGRWRGAGGRAAGAGVACDFAAGAGADVPGRVGPGVAQPAASSAQPRTAALARIEADMVAVRQ